MKHGFPMLVLGNNKILFEDCKNICEDQMKISKISLKIFREIREFFPLDISGNLGCS